MCRGIAHHQSRSAIPRTAGTVSSAFPAQGHFFARNRTSRSLWASAMHRLSAIGRAKILSVLRQNAASDRRYHMNNTTFLLAAAVQEVARLGFLVPTAGVPARSAHHGTGLRGGDGRRNGQHQRDQAHRDQRSDVLHSVPSLRYGRRHIAIQYGTLPLP